MSTQNVLHELLSLPAHISSRLSATGALPYPFAALLDTHRNDEQEHLTILQTAALRIEIHSHFRLAHLHSISSDGLSLAMSCLHALQNILRKTESISWAKQLSRAKFAQSLSSGSAASLLGLLVPGKITRRLARMVSKLTPEIAADPPRADVFIRSEQPFL